MALATTAASSRASRATAEGPAWKPINTGWFRGFARLTHSIQSPGPGSIWPSQSTSVGQKGRLKRRQHLLSVPMPRRWIAACLAAGRGGLNWIEPALSTPRGTVTTSLSASKRRGSPPGPAWQTTVTPLAPVLAPPGPSQITSCTRWPVRIVSPWARASTMALKPGTSRASPPP